MAAALLVSIPLESWLKEHPSWPGTLLALLALLVLIFVAFPRVASWRRAKDRPALDPTQVEALLTGTGALIVDLRDAESFRSGHIRGCLHVPFPELAARFRAPDVKATRAMVLVDETDALSHQAYDLLRQRGYDWMYVLKGGMRAWRRSNRPMNR